MRRRGHGFIADSVIFGFMIRKGLCEREECFPDCF